LNILQNG
jgi:IS30 family transposase